MSLDSKFNASFLVTQRLFREEQRIKTFNVVLERIHTRIEIANRVNKTSVIYIVPEMVLGHPCYQIRSIILFLVEKLIKEGFNVDFSEPKTLNISWKEAFQRSKNKNHHVKKKGKA